MSASRFRAGTAPPVIAGRARIGAAAAWTALVLVLLLFSGHALAAQRPASAGVGSPLDTLRADTVREAREPQGLRSPSPDSPLLDAPIDRNRYLLGPGDVLAVSIFGDFSRLETVPVTPEGAVLIPQMGVVDLSGMSLAQAQERIRNLVYRYYRNVDVYVNLAEVRRFKVFVVGDVPEPGVRIATAATRVSEVLSTLPDDSVARRNVLLRRATGDTLRVDLARFAQMGDLTANPALREGDAVVVATVDETVEIFGRVSFPGRYEYREGESLRELLELANGGRGFPSDAADSIRVSRFTGAQNREFLTLSRDAAASREGGSLVLQPFDAVYVPARSNYRTQQTATVLGQVRHPGTYPIRADTTTVSDLLKMAGGFSSNASLSNATLVRRMNELGLRTRKQLEEIPMELMSDEDRRVLHVLSQGNETSVIVDFQRLLADGEEVYDQPLMAGDTLVIPTRRQEVAVLGAVVQPGLLRHVAGADAAFYIGLAGGFGSSADRGDVVILKARTGARVDARNGLALDPGDTVVVPFKERRDWLQTLQSTNAVVASVTGLVLTFIAIFSR